MTNIPRSRSMLESSQSHRACVTTAGNCFVWSGKGRPSPIDAYCIFPYFSTFFYKFPPIFVLFLFFTSPTLTGMHLLIMLNMYWTPLGLVTFIYNVIEHLYRASSTYLLYIGLCDVKCRYERICYVC